MYPAEPAGYSGHAIPLKAQSDQLVACDRLSFIQVYVTCKTWQPRSSGNLEVFNRPKGHSGSRRASRLGGK